MNTTSTFWPRIGWPGRRSMYSSARSSARRAGVVLGVRGIGHAAVIGMPMPGFVP